GRAKNTYEINYADGQKTIVALANAPDGSNAEARAASVKARASVLPDWSVEQIFTSSTSGNESPLFTVRTTERDPELVQAAVNRLFTDDNGKTMLVETTASWTRVGDDFVFKFNRPVSKSFVKTQIERQLQVRLGDQYTAADVFDVFEPTDKEEA